MSWLGPLTLIGTLGAIVWGTLRLLAAVDRIEGRGAGGPASGHDPGGAEAGAPKDGADDDGPV